MPLQATQPHKGLPVQGLLAQRLDRHRLLRLLPTPGRCKPGGMQTAGMLKARQQKSALPSTAH